MRPRRWASMYPDTQVFAKFQVFAEVPCSLRLLGSSVLAPGSSGPMCRSGPSQAASRQPSTFSVSVTSEAGPHGPATAQSPGCRTIRSELRLGLGLQARGAGGLPELSAIRSRPDKRVATEDVTSVLDSWKNVAGYSFDFSIGRGWWPGHGCRVHPMTPYHADRLPHAEADQSIGQVPPVAGCQTDDTHHTTWTHQFSETSQPGCGIHVMKRGD